MVTRGSTEADPTLARRHRRVASVAGLVAVGMLGMSFAAVPLYRMFCQVTGFGGTVQRAERPSTTISERTVIVRYDANVGNGLGWTFKPVENTREVKLGENTLAFYRATNTSSEPITGTATFNVAPEAAGSYFNKIECFCFTEQTLAAGESIEMPVSFYVDPEMLNDKDARHITQITLSYTFYPVVKARQSAAPGRTTAGTTSDGTTMGNVGEASSRDPDEAVIAR